jgi:hypothetical protein
MNYLTSEGQFKFGLLDTLLTSEHFQNQLKQRFAQADYTVTYVGQRNLVSERVNEYLNQLQGEDYKFAATVLKRTLYVPFDRLIHHLRPMMERFTSKIGTEKYYIVLNRNKFASMALMLIQVFDLLNVNQFYFITSESKLPPNSHAVIIDDASYTGTNLEAMIDTLTYNNIHLTVHVLVPYMSRFMHQALSQTYNVRFYEPYLMLYMHEYLAEHNLAPFSDEIYKRFQAEGVLDLHNQLPLYFDHTVASKDSSYPTIYLEGIVPDNINYGSLIKYAPDQEVRSRVYCAYFNELLPPPMSFG